MSTPNIVIPRRRVEIGTDEKVRIPVECVVVSRLFKRRRRSQTGFRETERTSQIGQNVQGVPSTGDKLKTTESQAYNSMALRKYPTASAVAGRSHRPPHRSRLSLASSSKDVLPSAPIGFEGGKRVQQLLAIRKIGPASKAFSTAHQQGLPVSPTILLDILSTVLRLPVAPNSFAAAIIKNSLHHIHLAVKQTPLSPSSLDTLRTCLLVLVEYYYHRRKYATLVHIFDTSLSTLPPLPKASQLAMEALWKLHSGSKPFNLLQKSSAMMIAIEKAGGAVTPQIKATVVRRVATLVVEGRVLDRVLLACDWVALARVAIGLVSVPGVVDEADGLALDSQKGSTTFGPINCHDIPLGPTSASYPHVDVVFGAAEGVLTILEASKQALSTQRPTARQQDWAEERHRHLSRTLRPACHALMLAIKSRAYLLAERGDGTSPTFLRRKETTAEAKRVALMVRHKLLLDEAEEAIQLWKAFMNQRTPSVSVIGSFRRISAVVLRARDSTTLFSLLAQSSSVSSPEAWVLEPAFGDLWRKTFLLLARESRWTDVCRAMECLVQVFATVDIPREISRKAVVGIFPPDVQRNIVRVCVQYIAKTTHPDADSDPLRPEVPVQPLLKLVSAFRKLGVDLSDRTYAALSYTPRVLGEINHSDTRYQIRGALGHWRKMTINNAE